MRISEDRIRRIVREEARGLLGEGVDRLSILPADVPPELFMGWLRRVHRKLMGMVGMGVEGALQAAEIYAML